MGSIFGGGEKTVKQESNSEPWKEQQDFLEFGFDQAKDSYNQSVNNVSQLDNRVAAMNENQRAALSQIMNGSNQAFNTGTSLSDTGFNGAQGVGQSYFNSVGQTAAMAGNDRTDQVIGNASKFADNPYLQGQIDSALGDVSKAFDRESAGINNAASGTGNINSTRAGALEARALDDAQDRAAMVSSQMRGDAYNTGLGMANSNAARSFQEAMASDQALGQALGRGSGLAMDGYDLAKAGSQGALTAGSFEQSQEQRELDAARAAATEGMDLTGQYMNLVGGNYGGQTTSTQQQPTASPFQQMLGIGASIAGMGSGTGFGWWGS